MDFWQLPGSQGFLEEVGERLAAGVSVVLAIPRYGPPDVIAAVGEVARQRWNWQHFLADAGSDPAVLLDREFVYESGGGQVPDARSLAASRDLEGMAIAVSGITTADWPAWRRFVEDFAQASRNVSVAERALLVVEPPSEGLGCLPKEDVTLACVWWRGRLGELDTLIYATAQLSGRDLSRKRLRILAQVIAQLACWDCALAERLAEEAPRRVLEAYGILAEVAAERGWERATPASWAEGGVDEFDGQERVHSALLVARNEHQEVERRLWAAQAAVLMPEIEQQRLSLIPSIRRHLTLPFETPFGTVRNERDLEIGYIALQISRRPVDERTKRLVGKLRDARNCLAHMEALEPAWLLSDEIFPFLGKRS
jgi:hypothetical protein